ncbi:type VII secretion target [Lentzea cavernae]|uniref:Excreted virulence factor EspC, type VII ESX diderm n=1 Tax=Lentzea cavernae TaxID=2020703 RepID=A0ABQ3M681_9PSEU|nr:type VII secretion target [Lentzea cavernae]GHH34690.1 hypothetical protein GCM10017774_19070 [Lentzea cavernae]
MFECVKVEVETLRIGVSAAREVSETIVKAGELTDFGDAAMRALEGSTTARYAAGFEDLVHEQLTQCSKDFAEYQEKLSATADEYERVDQDQADALRRAGSGK